MTKIAQIGTLTGDVLLFGGPYSNLQAAQALFRAAVHIPKPNRICTGDIIAYCADPVATTSLVLSEAGHCIAGNCEVQIANEAADCGCGFEEGSSCDLAAKGWYPFASDQLGADLRSTFAALPDIAVFTHNGSRYAVIHGGMTDIARFIWSNSPETVFKQEFAAVEALTGPVDGVISGHSGIPFHRRIGGKSWINAGVIGMPPHDGSQRTSYATLGRDGVQFHQLTYDAKAAAQAMTRAGLTNGYETSLLTGIWPSEDVLPLDLRR
ncbi:metallophosphoesterase family protein [uncultured Litoreibacter sp.]|uniref:metallophosphoesterase family protein n=1 Tax=uncultured Litoreibacter sp. TaxID=1392394 RepID=UPI0026213FA0|nr:metallophosphoesterase family protein [uncultured Litoreibacter sp.]